MPSESQRFVGPRPFERGEGPLFFGRARESADLASLIIAHSAVLLYAQSGAGKTSLINAGLTPLLEDESFEVLPAARVRGELPDGEDSGIGAIKNVYIFNVLTGWGALAAGAAASDGTTLAGYLKARPPKLDADGEPCPRVILFDQFEELFTFYPERAADRRGFFEQVRDALNADRLLRVVFAMREEYLAELTPHAPLLPEQLRTRMRLERLREPAALEAITGPLKDSRVSFAPGVAEKLVSELLQVTFADRSQPLRGEYIEPVQLQVVCDGLCRHLPPEVTVITGEHLRIFGNVNQALAKFYEECLQETRRDAHVRIGTLRKWFRKVLITPEGTRDAVRMGRDETGGLPNRAVQKLEALHLVRGEERAGRGRWYELTHDRFVAPIRAANEKVHARWRLFGWVAAALIIVGLVITAFLVNEERKAERKLQLVATAMKEGARLAVNGKFEDALKQFEAVMKVDPENQEARIKAAEAHVEIAKGYISDMTKGAEAIRNEIEAAIKLAPDSPKPYAARGDLEMRIARDMKEADYPDYAQYREAFAQHQEAAKRHYQEAIATDEEWPGGYWGRGDVYISEGNIEAAIKDFKSATEQASGEGLARSHTALGTAWFWMGDFERALEECATGVALASTESAAISDWVEQDARQRLADVYYIKGRYDLAEMELLRALKIAEEKFDSKVDVANACSMLGFVALKKKDIKAAGDWFDKALSCEENYVALFGAGIVSKLVHKPDQAREYFEKAWAAANGTDPLDRMNRVVFSVALEKPDTGDEMRKILAGQPSPPLGMLSPVADDLGLLDSLSINPDGCKAIRVLLDNAINAERKKLSPYIEKANKGEREKLLEGMR